MSTEPAKKKVRAKKKTDAKSSSSNGGVTEDVKNDGVFDLKNTHTIEGFRTLCEKVKENIEYRANEKNVVCESIIALNRQKDELTRTIERDAKEARKALENTLAQRKDRIIKIEEELKKILESQKSAEVETEDPPVHSKRKSASKKKKSSSKKTPRETVLENEKRRILVDIISIESELTNVSYGKRYGTHELADIDKRISVVEAYFSKIDETKQKYVSVLKQYANYAELLCQKQKSLVESIVNERRNTLRWEKKRDARGQNVRFDRSDEERLEEQKLAEKHETQLKTALKKLAREMLSQMGLNLSVTRYVRSDFCPRCQSEQLRMLPTGGAMECIRCGYWQKHVDAASQTGGSFFFASTGNFGGTGTSSCGADSSSCATNKDDEDNVMGGGLSSSRKKKGGRAIERIFELANMDPRLPKESLDKAKAIIVKDCIEESGKEWSDLNYRDIAGALKRAKQESLYKHAVQISCHLLNKTVKGLTESQVDTLASIGEDLQEQKDATKDKRERSNIIWSTLLIVQQAYIAERPDLICFLDPIKTPNKIEAIEKEMARCYEKAYDVKYIYVKNIIASIDCPRPSKDSNLLDYGEMISWPGVFKKPDHVVSVSKTKKKKSKAKSKIVVSSDVEEESSSDEEED